jgi:hypothetical protein
VNEVGQALEYSVEGLLLSFVHGFNGQQLLGSVQFLDYHQRRVEHVAESEIPKTSASKIFHLRFFLPELLVELGTLLVV